MSGDCSKFDPDYCAVFPSGRDWAYADARDQFAMAALTGLALQDRYYTVTSLQIARDAYRIADAMMMERRNPNHPIETGYGR